MPGPSGPAAPTREAIASSSRRRAPVNRAPQLSGGHDAAALRQLQQRLGNLAVSRMLDADRRAAQAVRASAGRPIEPAARQAMESRFGEDLSSVRVHTDPAACEAVGANAYALGEHIVFAAGTYAPHRQAGRGLLAHELAHVIQQRRGPGGMPQARLESEAGRVGHAAARGSGPIAVRGRAGVGLAFDKITTQRLPDVFEVQLDGNTIVSIDGVAVLSYPTENSRHVDSFIQIKGGTPITISIGVRTTSDSGARLIQSGLTALGKQYNITAVVDTKVVPFNEFGGELQLDRPSLPPFGRTLDLTPTPKPASPANRQRPARKQPAAPRQPAKQPAETRTPPQQLPALPPPADPTPTELIPEQQATPPDPPAQQPAPPRAPVQVLQPQKDPTFGSDLLPSILLTPPVAAAPAAAQPAPENTPLSADLADRLATIRKNLKKWTWNFTWESDILNAFKDLSPTDFTRLQTELGEDGMTDVFDQLPSFYSTLIGSWGPIVRGRNKLNENRVDYAMRARKWGSQNRVFYRWMFSTMPIEDVRVVLAELADRKRLHETVLTVPGLAATLMSRGITEAELTEEDTTFFQGVKRGASRWWSGAWSGTIFGEQGPGLDETYLPKDLPPEYYRDAGEDFEKALTPGNIVRGAASNVTFGLSDVPFGIYDATKLTVEAAGDLWNGKSGAAAEKLTPVALTILAALVGKKLGGGKAGGVAAAEDAATLATVEEAVLADSAAASREWDVRKVGQTPEGFDRYIGRHGPSGEFIELVIDPKTKNMRATRVATGEVATVVDGQVARAAPALPPAGGEIGLDTTPRQVSPFIAPPAAPPLFDAPGLQSPLLLPAGPPSPLVLPGLEPPLGLPAGPASPRALPPGPRPPLALPAGPLAPLALPPGPRPPFALPAGPLSPLALPPGPRPPLALPAGPASPLALPPGPRPPFALPAGSLSPLVLPPGPRPPFALPAGPPSPLALPPGPRPPIALPPAYEDFGDLGRQLAQQPGSGFGEGTIWSVTPDGVVFATPPVPGLPLYVPEGLPPPASYFAGRGQPRSWVLSGPLQPNFTPFDVLPGQRATTRSLSQVRSTRGSNLKGSAGSQHIAELSGGQREVTLQLPGGVTRRSDVISPTIVGSVNQEVKNYLRYIGQANPAREVPWSAFMQTEIDRDLSIMGSLRQQSVWVFTDAPPSAALAQALDTAGIPYIVSTDRLPTR